MSKPKEYQGVTDMSPFWFCRGHGKEVPCTEVGGICIFCKTKSADSDGRRSKSTDISDNNTEFVEKTKEKLKRCNEALDNLEEKNLQHIRKLMI